MELYGKVTPISACYQGVANNAPVEFQEVSIPSDIRTELEHMYPSSMGILVDNVYLRVGVGNGECIRFNKDTQILPDMTNLMMDGRVRGGYWITSIYLGYPFSRNKVITYTRKRCDGEWVLCDRPRRYGSHRAYNRVGSIRPM